jgi:type I restriction enzyme S subunit
LISRKDYDQLVKNGCRPAKNDVLITKDGANYLKHIFVVREDRELVLLSSVAILTPNARINPHLLAAILGAPENKDRLKNFVTGAAIPRVILKDFKQFRILLPAPEVQQAWASIAEPLTHVCWTLIEQNQTLRRTRDLLLPRLMSGQIALDEAVA